MKGIRITDEQMHKLNLRPHSVLPQWNYTLRPQRPNTIAANSNRLTRSTR